jgi:hypothetical protein
MKQLMLLSVVYRTHKYQEGIFHRGGPAAGAVGGSQRGNHLLRRQPECHVLCVLL